MTTYYILSIQQPVILTHTSGECNCRCYIHICNKTHLAKLHVRLQYKLVHNVESKHAQDL